MTSTSSSLVSLGFRVDFFSPKDFSSINVMRFSKQQLSSPDSDQASISYGIKISPPLLNRKGIFFTKITSSKEHYVNFIHREVKIVHLLDEEINEGSID